MLRIARRVAGSIRRRLQPEPLTLQQRYPQYRIGKGSYGPLEVKDWGEGATLVIGAYCSIAAGVKVFLGGEHRMDWGTTYPFNVLWQGYAGITGHPRTKGDVVIGNDVWIATEAVIMSGVTIGDGAVIGARALVTKDVPPYGVVAGNPAQLVKYRFSEQVIARMMEVKWWDWDDERIRRAIPDLLSKDVGAFLEGVASSKY